MPEQELNLLQFTTAVWHSFAHVRRLCRMRHRRRYAESGNMPNLVGRKWDECTNPRLTRVRHSGCVRHSPTCSTALLCRMRNRRRTCAKLCHTNGGELEQIQFLLGHASVLTAERYLGCKQNLGHPVNATEHSTLRAMFTPALPARAVFLRG